MPDSNDMLASLVITGANTSAYDFSNVHGITSSGDDLDGILDSEHGSTYFVSCDGLKRSQGRTDVPSDWEMTTC